MRVRTSGTILASPHPEGWLFYDFMCKTAALCSTEAVALLRRLNQWCEFEDAAMSGGEHSHQRIRNVLSDMLQNNLLVEEGSEQSDKETEFFEKWKWGTAAAALHFSTLNTPFMSADKSAAEQIARFVDTPPPKAYTANPPGAICLPDVETAYPSIVATMLRRRTNRSVSTKELSLKDLSDCLFAGFAITGEVDTPSGKMPLSIAPSGGARNPYEAYVYAHAVTGLDPGFYHYSGSDHSLNAVNLGIIEYPELMLGGQDWAHEMPAIIIFVAHFERTMWKYQEANAYRVTMIEAGHRAQNIMLTATERGLTACPTAALHHQTICEHLALNDVLTVPIYALTLSRPNEAAVTAIYT